MFTATCKRSHAKLKIRRWIAIIALKHKHVYTNFANGSFVN